jgi:uncharacterized membrane protein YhaH (DUF805 family)
MEPGRNWRYTSRVLEKTLLMFKSIFSFEGRIRRKEYCFSFLIYICVATLLQALLYNALSHYSQNQDSSVLFLLLFIPCLMFIWAQGAKRCHDLGNSGWFQLIPFYVFWLLFADSQWGLNQYGSNPKGTGNIEFSFEQENHPDNA